MATTYLLESFFLLLARAGLVPRVPTPLPDRAVALPEGCCDIDNDMYDTDEFAWWSDDCGLHHLNPVRISYFIDKLSRYEHEKDAATKSRRKILDVGCGAGIATEAIARRLDPSEYHVVGIDPSSRSVQIAADHAATENVSVEYLVGSVYELPFESNSIDGIICSDVLEHLYDLPKALSEIARVLKPNAVFTFDTINRTPLSYYLSIWILQDLLKAMQADAHDHRLFVTPSEMHVLMSNARLQPGPRSDLIGMRPAIQWPHITIFRLLSGRGFMSSVITDFKQTQDLSISYLHWGRKQQSTQINLTSLQYVTSVMSS